MPAAQAKANDCAAKPRVNQCTAAVVNAIATAPTAPRPLKPGEAAPRAPLITSRWARSVLRRAVRLQRNAQVVPICQLAASGAELLVGTLALGINVGIARAALPVSGDGHIRLVHAELG